MMALRLACEASDQFSAIVSNAATFGNVDRYDKWKGLASPPFSLSFCLPLPLTQFLL